jgi:hypothetical protein
MYLSFASRDAVLEHLPKDATVAEIGVAEGEFSDRILAVAKPKKLHLIDPWAFQSQPDYLADHNNVEQAEQDARYESISNKFKREISSGQVVLHRGYSQDLAGAFEDAYFDWIYIDGMHTYDAVLRDLHLYQPKVKAGGLILGHDYADHLNSQKMNFGVVPAVDRFVKESGWQFILLTLEAYPTYILAAPGDQASDQLARAVVFDRGGIRFPDYPKNFSFSQFVMSDPTGQYKVFPEFRVQST